RRSIDRHSLDDFKQSAQLLGSEPRQSEDRCATENGKRNPQQRESRNPPTEKRQASPLARTGGDLPLFLFHHLVDQLGLGLLTLGYVELHGGNRRRARHGYDRLRPQPTPPPRHGAPRLGGLG